MEHQRVMKLTFVALTCRQVAGSIGTYRASIVFQSLSTLGDATLPFVYLKSLRRISFRNQIRPTAGRRRVFPFSSLTVTRLASTSVASTEKTKNKEVEKQEVESATRPKNRAELSMERAVLPFFFLFELSAQHCTKIQKIQGNRVAAIVIR